MSRQTKRRPLAVPRQVARRYPRGLASASQGASLATGLAVGLAVALGVVLVAAAGCSEPRPTHPAAPGASAKRVAPPTAGSPRVATAARRPAAPGAGPRASHEVASDSDAPFRAWTSLRGDVAAGVPLSAQVRVQAEPGVIAFKTSLRGLGGVRVSGGGPQPQDPARGDATRTVTVTVPAGVRGYVVVDIQWQANQQPRAGSTSLAIPIGARGAQATGRTLGVVRPGPEGAPVQVMPSR